MGSRTTRTTRTTRTAHRTGTARTGRAVLTSGVAALVAVAGLGLGAAPATAAPVSAGALAADPSSNYTCDPGLYRINTSSNSRPLTVALSRGNYGTVLQYFWGDESNQKWRVCRKRAADGRQIVYLQDAWRRWCMAVDHWGLENGDLITTYGCIDENVPLNQQFWMANPTNSTTLFALQGLHSGKWVASSDHSNEIRQMVQDRWADLFYLQAV
ncbi:RICIN domain-containing protein [Kitasatospora purpeofusca]|uniref:RICIN domain-containing protein n=1 Tax=Kitasatospora purpeofusca TaxID=67352 RepID=UPI003828912D